MRDKLFTKMSGLNKMSMVARADYEIDAILLQARDGSGKVEFIMSPESAIDLAGEIMLAVLELTKSKRTTKN